MMSAQVRVPNERIRAYREQLGKTQEELGDLLSGVVWSLHQRVVHITGGMVSKWERGIRRPTKLYREAYRVLFNASDEELGFVKRRQLLKTTALGMVTVAAVQPSPARAPVPLTREPSSPATKETKRQYAPEVVAGIRTAMLGGSGVGNRDRDPDLRDLEQRVVKAWQFRQQARYLELGGMLPGLLRDTETAVQEFGRTDSGPDAYWLLTHTYNTTSSVLKKLGDFELASIAADRAVRAARTVDDPLLSAAAAYRLANVFLSAGRLDEAKLVALGAASGLEAGLGAVTVQLAVWGGLLLTAALAAACQGDAAEAWQLLGQAATAGYQLGGDYADLHTIFGPTNVAIHGVQIAAELGDGREALRRSAGLDADRLPPSLLERRSHLLIDVARGHAQQADDGAAVATLLAADRVAPQEVRFNPVVFDLVALLLRRERRGAAPGLRTLAANVGLAS